MLRQRTHATNYIPRSSQKRLDEVIPAFLDRIANSLAVDSTEASIYWLNSIPRTGAAAASRGTRCSCSAGPQLHQLDTTAPLTPPHFGEPRTATTINTQAFLFGDERPGDPNPNPLGIDPTRTDLGMEPRDPDPRRPSPGAVWGAGSVDCGICYRTGSVPALVSVNSAQLVLLPTQLTASSGYTLDRSTFPHTLVSSGAWNSYVQWEILVPKYWKRCYYSVRNNTVVLPQPTLHTTLLQPGPQRMVPLTATRLRQASGTTLTLQVQCVEQFTHVVLEFDYGLPTIVNVAAETLSLDYTMLDTLGSLQIIVPSSVAMMRPQDLIFLRRRGIGIKVTDVSKLMSSRRKTLEWQVTGRILQPSETARYAATHFLLAD